MPLERQQCATLEKAEDKTDDCGEHEGLHQAVERLSQEVSQKEIVIQYQRQEIHDLTIQLNDFKSQQEGRKTASEKREDGTLLPLLESMEEEVSKDRKSSARQFLIDAFLNNHSRYYELVNNLLVGLILFSVMCVILESVPSLMNRWRSFFYWSEIIVTILFTIEYAINIYVARDKMKYIFGPWGLIDLLAILPSYFHIMDLRDIKLARTLRVVRFLRTLRIARILKITKSASSKYQNSAKKRVNTLKLDLQIYTITLFTVITIFSTLIYYAERNVHNTTFTSIPASMWWCIVTIATVGYGDMCPATVCGKLIAAFTMISGLALLGILMNVIGKAMMTSLFGSTHIGD